MRFPTRHLIARHLRDERRRIEADNADQLAKAKDDVEKDVAWYGQRHAELTAENGRLATLVDDLTGALAEAEERAERHHGDAEMWKRFTTAAEQARDRVIDAAEQLDIENDALREQAKRGGP